MSMLYLWPSHLFDSCDKHHNKKWEYFGVTVQDSIAEFNTNLEEVNLLCKEINTLKSSGIDELSARLCKDAFLVLGQQLVHLFNCSLRIGNFPNKWKVGKIIPLFKGVDRESVNNYRPVSLLPLTGNSSGNPELNVCKSQISPPWALLILLWFSYYFTALTD